MLSIRMQRTGRRGHAMFRVVVQDSRLTPTSGRVVAQIGSYDPHAKTSQLDKESAVKYLTNGAQPSDRVAMLFAKEGIELPKWYKKPAGKSVTIKNQDKLRRNQPKEEAVEAPAAAEAETADVEA